jgi:hypothetical protein
MYKFPVRRATDNLDGRCTKKLASGRMDSVAARLKKIRLSLPGAGTRPAKPGVREIARALGYDMPNHYGYYEDPKFKKSALPLDKAREIAAVFQLYGGDPADVMALAGLSQGEIPVEKPRHESEIAFAMLPVALPSSERLTTMMRGLLKAVGLEREADEYAERLARLLPSALAQSAADPQSRLFELESSPGIAIPRPPKDRRAQKQ